MLEIKQHQASLEIRGMVWGQQTFTAMLADNRDQCVADLTDHIPHRSRNEDHIALSETSGILLLHRQGDPMDVAFWFHVIYAQANQEVKGILIDWLLKLHPNSHRIPTRP